MKRFLLALFFLAAIPDAAQCQVLFTDNFDGYTTNVAIPQGPWFSDNALTAPPLNTFANPTQNFSSPNSADVGHGGNNSAMFRAITPTHQAFISAEMWFTDQSCGNCDWQVPTLGFDRQSGGSSFPNIVFGGGNIPPLHKTNLQTRGCDGNIIGNVNVSSSAWHSIILAMRCNGNSGDYTLLVVDGGLQSMPATGPANQVSDEVEFTGQVVGGTPNAEAYIDNLSVTNGIFGTIPGEPRTIWLQ